MQEQKRFLEELSSEFKIEIEHVPIESILPERNLPEEVSKIKQLGGFFEDFVEILRQAAIVRYCAQHKVSKVILPEFSEMLSSRALSLLCKSRSVEIAQNCASSFRTEAGVLVGRPLHDTSNREMLFFARNNDLFRHVFNDCQTFEKNIQKVVVGSNFAKYIAEGSIGMLLDQFVEEVQGEYSSTSATILRTVDKLDFAGQPDSCSNCGHGFDSSKDLASLVQPGAKKSGETGGMLCSGCKIMFGMLEY